MGHGQLRVHVDEKDMGYGGTYEKHTSIYNSDGKYPFPLNVLHLLQIGQAHVNLSAKIPTAHSIRAKQRSSVDQNEAIFVWPRMKQNTHGFYEAYSD